MKSFLFRHRKATSTVPKKPLPINDDFQNVRDYDTNRFHDDLRVSKMMAIARKHYGDDAES